MDHENLKQLVEKALEECEAVLEILDSAIQSSDKTSFAQLKEIEKAITSLQSMGHKVPDELRQLKLNLISGCDRVEDLKNLRKKFFDEIDRIFPKPSISKQTEIKSIPQKQSSKSSPKLFPPDKTFCRFKYNGIEYVGQIQNGRFYINGQGSFTSFSAASVKISRTSRNGWRDWELRLPGSNQWLLADAWRETQKYSKNENG